MEHFNFL